MPESISVHVRMHGLLRLLVQGDAGECGLTLPAGATVLDALGELEAIGLGWLVAVDGVAVPPAHVLRQGNTLDIYPPIEGG